jgi:hypothetical protein
VGEFGGRQTFLNGLPQLALGQPGEIGGQLLSSDFQQERAHAASASATIDCIEP